MRPLVAALLFIAFLCVLVLVVSRTVIEFHRAAEKRTAPVRVFRAGGHGLNLLIEMSGGVWYRGGSTVWHTWPDGERASLRVESCLSEVWQRVWWWEEAEQKARLNERERWWWE